MQSLSYFPSLVDIICSSSQMSDDDDLKSIVDILRDEDMASYIDVSNNSLRFYLEKEQYTTEIVEWAPLPLNYD